MTEKIVNLEEKLIEYEEAFREEDRKKRKAEYMQRTTKLERAFEKVSDFFQIDLPVAFANVFKKKPKFEPLTPEQRAKILEDLDEYGAFRETYLSYLARYNESKIGTIETFKNRDGSTTTIAHTEFGPIIKTEYKTKVSTSTSYEGFIFRKWSDGKYHFEGKYANVKLTEYNNPESVINDEQYTDIHELKHYTGFGRGCISKEYKFKDEIRFRCKYWDEGGYYDEIDWMGARLPKRTERKYREPGYREGLKVLTLSEKNFKEKQYPLNSMYPGDLSTIFVECPVRYANDSSDQIHSFYEYLKKWYEINEELIKNAENTKAGAQPGDDNN